MGNIISEPFILKPVGKDYLWGGTRLKSEFNKNIEMNPLAETWECSTHPDGISVVATGLYEGKKLSDVIEENPSILGSHSEMLRNLPILIKLIDAKQDLSIQVHPTDEYAKKYENGASGKTEMWYVLDAKQNAKIVYGFNRKITKETLKRNIENGKIEKYLQKVNIKKDDLFLIEAGQVHAIGEGSLIAEIQENSNITYRLYDYNRVDKNGEKRQLHIDKAIDVVNISNESPKQPLRVLKFKNGIATELLCRCKYFQVERILLNTEKCKEMASYKTNSLSFHVLLCIDGCRGIIF